MTKCVNDIVGCIRPKHWDDICKDGCVILKRQQEQATTDTNSDKEGSADEDC